MILSKAIMYAYSFKKKHKILVDPASKLISFLLISLTSLLSNLIAMSEKMGFITLIIEMYLVH